MNADHDRPPLQRSSTGLPPTLAAVLAYGAWWVSGLLFWWAEEYDAYVRFHAVQSVIAFGTVAVFIVGFAILATISLSTLPGAFAPFMWAAGATWVAGILLWLAAIWHAAHGRQWQMPVIGPLAARLARTDK